MAATLRSIVAPLGTLSKHSVSFFKWGDHAWTQYSIRGRIYISCMSRKSSLSSILKFLLIIPITDLALAADLTHCVLDFKSSVTCTPRSFSSSVCSIAMLFPASSCRWYTVHGLCPIWIILHLLAFSFSSHFSDHLVRLWRSSCRVWLSTSDLMTFQIFTSSANILMLFLIHSGKSFTNNKKATVQEQFYCKNSIDTTNGQIFRKFCCKWKLRV